VLVSLARLVSVLKAVIPVLVGAGCEMSGPLEPSEACLVSGDGQGSRVRISVPGAESFDVGLRDGAFVDVSFTEGEPPRARVRGPHVEFYADPTPLEYHLATEVDFGGGMLRLLPTVSLDNVARVDDGLTATAYVSWDMRLEGLRLGCGDVVVGDPASSMPEGIAQATAEPAPRQARMMSRAPRLVVHALPDDARAITVNMEAPELVSFGALREEAGWTELEWNWKGVRLRGWAESSALRRTELPESQVGGWVCGGVCAIIVDGPRERRLLRPGALIHAAPGAGPWARVHRAVEVLVTPVDASWGKLYELPDVQANCGDHYTYVPLTDTLLLGPER
jgi:hypothetical protein